MNSSKLSINRGSADGKLRCWAIHVDSQFVFLCKLICVSLQKIVNRPIEGAFCETCYTLMDKG